MNEKEFVRRSQISYLHKMMKRGMRKMGRHHKKKGFKTKVQRMKKGR